MKLLITGGAGFIGSHIADKLIELDHDVVIIDNLVSGKKEFINPKAKFFEFDICNKDKIDQIFEEYKPEIVFHLAAQNEVPYSMAHPFEDEKINIVGTLNLLEASKKNNVKKFIYSNTGGAFYGDIDEKELPIKEDTPILKPTSFYGVSKLSAEMYLRLFSHVYGLIGISLRYSNVYGPRQDGNKESGVVAIFTEKLLKKEQPTIHGDGSKTRDYIYVDDVVDANIKAMNLDKSDYFNISTGTRITVLEVFQALEKELKTGIKPIFGEDRTGDAQHNSLSPDKAKQVLNWEAITKFDEGIKKTLYFYQNKD